MKQSEFERGRLSPPIVLCALLALAGCSKPTGEPRAVAFPPVAPLQDGPGVRVLFIGNSLTAGSSVPRMVEAMAAAGGKKVLHRGVVFAGTGLTDHWKQNHAQGVIAREKWDFVVLQQSGSADPAVHAELKAVAADWGALIRKHGAKPAFYAPWPLQGTENGFKLVADSYRAAADAAGGVVFPVGDAWEATLKDDPNLELYAGDGRHATPAGSYLAALVITHGLTGVRPDTSPTKIDVGFEDPIEVPEAVAAKLRRAAAAVIK